MPDQGGAESTDYATMKQRFGIIRDAALYAGFGPGSIELFGKVWESMREG
jgi:hypothetical protein